MTDSRRFDPFSVLGVLTGLAMLYAGTIPFDFSSPLAGFENEVNAALDWRQARISRADILSNILFFVPFGLLCGARQASRGRGFVLSVLLTAVVSACLSLLIETLQLYSPQRYSSFVDLATDTFGGTVAAPFGWWFLRFVWPALRPRLAALRDRPLRAIAWATAAIVVVLSLEPFDLNIEVDALKKAIKSLRPIPFGAPLRGSIPSSEPWAWTLETVVWTLIGGTMCLAHRERRSWRLTPLVAVPLTCALLAAVVETLQLGVESRSTDATNVVFAAVGGLIGAAVPVATWNVRSSRFSAPAIVVAFGALALARWTPPEWLPSGLETFHWRMLVPFLQHYEGVNRMPVMGVVSDIVIETVTFLPIGILLAIASERWTVWRAACVGLLLGVVLEAGQLVHATRTADMTDALFGALGCGIGVYAWRAITANWTRRSAEKAHRETGADSTPRDSAGVPDPA